MRAHSSPNIQNNIRKMLVQGLHLQRIKNDKGNTAPRAIILVYTELLNARLKTGLFLSSIYTTRCKVDQLGANDYNFKKELLEICQSVR